MYETSLPV